jgi:hypothetical protein
LAEIGQPVKSAAAMELRIGATIADSFNLPRPRAAQTLSSAGTCEPSQSGDLTRDRGTAIARGIGCTANPQPL